MQARKPRLWAKSGRSTWPCQGQRQSDRILPRLARVIIRHADAGYEKAIEMARAKGVEIPGLA